jgi:hypothetical protein
VPDASLFGRPRGPPLLTTDTTDTIDRIALANHPAELDEIVRGMWVDHRHGLLTEDDMEALDEAARERREALQACRATRGAETRPKPRGVPQNAPRATARRPRTPDRQASIERRRRMVGTIAMPPSLAAKFTWGEVAVLRVIGDQVKRHGSCSLYIDAIAAMAGMHRTTVQNALRQARRLGLITVEERRPPGRRKSLNNIVRIVSKEWLTWLRKGPRVWAVPECGSDNRAPRIQVHSLKGGRPQKGLPWGVPDGVFPCEGVA